MEEDVGWGKRKRRKKEKRGLKNTSGKAIEMEEKKDREKSVK